MTTPQAGSSSDGERLRVLLVEDNIADVRLLQESLLEVSRPRLELVHVGCLGDAILRLAAEPFDVVLLDLSLPDAHGLESLERAKQVAPCVPIVVLTGLADEEVAVDAARRGAQDYLVKGELDGRIMARSIRYAVQRKHAEGAAQRLAVEQRARERAEATAAHSRTLARLGDVLSSSLDLGVTLPEAAAVFVPGLAQRCWIDVAEDTGELRRAAEASASFGLEQPAESSKPEAEPQVLELPLLSRGRRIGQLSLQLRPSPPGWPDDLDLLHECARKIALAIDNARLYRAREEVISVVSHDLRNPLNVISLANALLGRDGLSKELQQRQSDKIRRAVDQMNRLIEDLLDVSRLDGGTFPLQRERIDAAAVAHDVIEMFRAVADDRGVELDIAATPGETLSLDADRGRLVQAVANLVGNAVKFTPKGGRVVIELDRKGDRVRFGVRDTGPGIPQIDLPRVFDRFWQGGRESRQGAGLGLAIARGIVQAHGGRITVDSELGVGTTFHVLLGLASEQSDGGIELNEGGTADLLVPPKAGLRRAASA